MAETSDTVFVRGLQPGTHDDELNEAFSEIGPVKSAFIVVEKDGPKKGQSRGFGFVQFALPEDAAAAVDKMHGADIGGSTVKLALAQKRGFRYQENRGQPQRGGAASATASSVLAARPKPAVHEIRRGGDDDDDDDNDDGEGGSRGGEKRDRSHRRAPDNFFRQLAREAVVKTATPKAKSQKSGEAETSDQEEARIDRAEELLRDSSVILFNLPAGATAAQVRRKAGKTGKVNMVEYPLTSLSLGVDGGNMALVVFTKKTSAATALRKLDGKLWEADKPQKGKKRGESKTKETSASGPSSRVACRRIKQIALDDRARSTRCRLIVRNLNFSTTEKHLRTAFVSFGPVLQIFLAKEKDAKKSKGYAFVQFACRLDAQQALESVNGTKINGRVVAVDWTLDKRDYERLQAESRQAPGANDDASDDDDDDDDDDDEDEEDEEEDEEEKDGKAPAPASVSEDDDESSDESDDGAEDNPKDGAKPMSEDEDESDSDNSDSDGSDAEDDDDDDDDDNDDEEEEEEEKAARGDGKRTTAQRFEEEKLNTLFLRNVLFETTEEELFETFRQFGGVRYVRVVKGADGRSRGSAFVNFYNHASMQRALAKAAEVPVVQKVFKRKQRGAQTQDESPPQGGSGIMCAGRPLLATPAVNPTEAKNLIEEREKAKTEKVDRRHLYLAREGRVHEGDGVEIPEQDLQKRQRAEREKQTKLRSPMFFVSPTRLSVRNLFRGGLGEDATYPEPTEKSLQKIFRRAARKGLEAGLVAGVDGDESLFPRGWPDETHMKPVSVKYARIMREETPMVQSADIEAGLSTSTTQASGSGAAGKGEPEDAVAAAKAKGGKVTRGKQKVLGRSTGFAFVEFTEHVHALAALRLLNNNPAYAYLAAGGPRSMAIRERERSRLIVEFSVENAAKLRVREQRLEKQRKGSAMQKNAQLAASLAAGETAGAASKPKPSGKKTPIARGAANGTTEPARQGTKRPQPGAAHTDAPQRKQRRADGRNGKFGSRQQAHNEKRGQKPQQSGSDRRGAAKAERKTKVDKKPHLKHHPAVINNASTGKVDASAFRKLVDQYKAGMAGGASKASSTKKQRWFDVA